MKLLRILNTKVLPITLSAAILINVQIPLYAQQNPYVRQYVAVRDNTNVVNRNLELALAKSVSIPKIPFTLTFQEVSQAAAKEAKNNKLSNEDYNAIYSQYTAALKQQDAQVAHVAALLRKEYNPESLISYYERKASKSGAVCEGKYCYPIEVWMHGILRVIIYQSTGQDTNHKQFKNNRDIMLAAVPHIYSIVTNYGLNRNDAYSLQKYLRFVVEGADKYCDNDTYMADIAPGLAGGNGRADARIGKERRQNECANIGKAMITLGMTGPWEQDKNQNAKIIYNAVKDTYKDDYGAITLSTGVNALIAVDTKTAYDFIEALLTKDTLPAGTTFKAVKNFGGQILDLLSVSSWADKGIEAVNLSRGGGGRYLNDYSQSLQYIDEDYSRASGMSDFNISVAKTNPSLGYNVSYRNVLEDIGIMLGQAQNPAAVKLSNKIIAQYTALEARRPLCLRAANFSPLAFETCSPSKNIHMPLVTGILQSARSSAGTAAAKFINTLDWWDLNEGTQRRVNNSVTGKFGGTVKRTLNEAKKKRNDNNKKIAAASFWADVLVSAIFITALVNSIPSMARSVSNAARTMRVTVSGKGNLLKITRARIAAGGINPQAVKLNLAAKYKQVKSAPKAAVAKPAHISETANSKSINIKLTNGKGAQKDMIASYSKSGKVKITEQIKKPSSPKAEGTLQENKQIFDQKNFFSNLTAQVGEGSGGAGGGISSGGRISYTLTPSSGKPLVYTPAISTPAEVVKPLARVFTQPAQSKVISADRVRKAAFSANISYYKNIAGQFMHTLRTKTGAMAMAVNLSLANPVMLNAASSGKIMPMIETISSYERATAATGAIIRGTKAMPLTETTKLLVKDINFYNTALTGAETQKLLTTKTMLPVFKSSLKAMEITSRNLHYTGHSTIRVLPKYVLSSYLWLSTLTFSSNTPQAKPPLYTKEQLTPLKNEHMGDSPLRKANQGYQSLMQNADEHIGSVIENKEIIAEPTIAKLQETFRGMYTKEQFKELSATDNLNKLTMISSTISKSLFDRMLSLISAPNADKDAKTILQSKNKKALDKLIAAKTQNNNIFTNFFDAVMLGKEKNPETFFTLNSAQPLPKEAFSMDAVAPQADLLPTMIKSFFKTKSLKDITIQKSEAMPLEKKDAVIARILSLTKVISSLEQNGYVKGTVKPVLVGSKYQWEEIVSLQPQNIVISVEFDKGDIGLEIAKWIEKRNIPNSGGDYFKHIPAWIADQLGLSAQNPGRFTRDEQSFNYFIYNSDGTSRVRFGPHEMNPVDPHIHIERLNTNGEWDGIVNEAYHSGQNADVKAKAERARSLFEQNTQKTETQLNRQADDVGRTFMPVATFLGSMEGFKAAAEVSKAADKPEAVKNLLKILEEVSTDKYFLNHLNELKAQGLVK